MGIMQNLPQKIERGLRNVNVIQFKLRDTAIYAENYINSYQRINLAKSIALVVF
jgi:hypothetical protein